MEFIEYDWFLFFDKGNVRISCPWRILKNGRKLIASGDHEQIYGLPKRIDAGEEVGKILFNKKIKKFRIEDKTGDIQISFDQNIIFQTFNFFSYEPWGITAPNGANFIFNDEICHWDPQIKFLIKGKLEDGTFFNKKEYFVHGKNKKEAMGNMKEQLKHDKTIIHWEIDQ